MAGAGWLVGRRQFPSLFQMATRVIEQHYTIGDLAARLQCHRRTIERALRDGSIPRHVRIGRSVRIPASAAAAFLGSRQVDQP